MAVDEALLDWAAETGGMAWRFYRWDEPTLSLGYFQSFADRAQHPASRWCPVVRRATGGGAIVHDAELTYSFVVPAGHPLAARRLDLYRAVHETLIETVAAWGISATLSGEEQARRPEDPPFLCFLRRCRGDVLVDSSKIAGSAQRRCRGAVLQHGSVILERSAAAPELEGLNAWAAAPFREEELARAWLPQLAGKLGFAWRPSPLTDAERNRAIELMESRYGSPVWTQRRDR